MSIDFTGITNVLIPEGIVKRITRKSDGTIIWRTEPKNLTYHGQTTTNILYGPCNLASTTVGKYALFGGGNSGSSTFSYVKAYDETLTHSYPTELSSGSYSLAATNVGNYALFAGGYTGSSYVSNVNAYNENLTRSKPTA